ncbi:MAG: glutamate--tRNA ligase [Planctomycetota bacterium]|nr:glutamate--tRNA ligase [Planctomycetota bacterium]
MTPRTRLAPSPTGEPHIGNMYVALFNWAFARQTGGQFLIRIEDTDRSRFVEGAEAMILEALQWLGLDYDEGPDRGGPVGPYRQSQRLEIYREHADRLLAAGHAYRCFCTAERLKELRQRPPQAGQAAGYDRLCRALDPAESARRAAAGEPHTVRLAVPLEGETRFADGLRGEITIANAMVDDQVLIKSDGFPTYHMAVVVDDRLMGVTHVIRAEEWITSTPKHVLLYQALGWELPQFYHVSLIRNPDRSKLSKRKNPTNVLWYRREGFLPEAVVNYLGMLGHSMPDQREIFTLAEFREAFSWQRVNTTGPVFDMDKFEWLNGEWIRRMPVEDLAARLRSEGFMPAGLPDAYVPGAVKLMQPRLKRLKEFADGVAFFVSRLPYEPALLIPDKKGKPLHTAAETCDALARMRAALAALPGWTAAALEPGMRSLAADLGWKHAELYTTLRVAITCRRISTPLFETMEILGREECLARVDGAIEKAQALA